MILYIIYGLIILVTSLLYFLVKNKKEFINKLGKISFVSGIIVLCLGLTTSFILNTFLTNFNIVKISSIIFEKFLYNSIILVILGLIELFISRIINKKKHRQMTV